MGMKGGGEVVVLLFDSERILLGLIWEEAKKQLGIQSKFKGWSICPDSEYPNNFFSHLPALFFGGFCLCTKYQQPSFTSLLGWPPSPTRLASFSLSDFRTLAQHFTNWIILLLLQSCTPPGGTTHTAGARCHPPLSRHAHTGLLRRCPFSRNGSHRRNFRVQSWLCRRQFLIEQVFGQRLWDYIVGKSRGFGAKLWV